MQAKDLKLTDEVLEVLKSKPTMADVFEELGFELDEAFEELDKAKAWVDEFVKDKVNLSHIIAEFVRTLKPDATFDDYLRALLLFDKLNSIMDELKEEENLGVGKVVISKGAVVLEPQDENEVVAHFITKRGDRTIESAFRADFKTAIEIGEFLMGLVQSYTMLKQVAMIKKALGAVDSADVDPCPECDEPSRGESDGDNDKVAC